MRLPLDDLRVVSIEQYGVLVEYEHPDFGSVRTMRTPRRLSQIDKPPLRRAPYLGEDSETVLREVRGYDDERIESLFASGLVDSPERMETS
jgi:formyl-CoA transferase